MNIPLLAMRGIIWRALNEWQMRTKRPTSEITQLPLSERLFIAKEIFNIAKRDLKTLLIEPLDQNEKLLDIVFEKAFRYYMDYINKIR